MGQRVTYSGTGSVEDFLEKIRLHVDLKGYDGEKRYNSIEIIRRSVPGLYAVKCG